MDNHTIASIIAQCTIHIDESIPSSPYYFTFGNSDTMPYQNGWIIIYAPDEATARNRFKRLYPSNNGPLRCAFVYSEEAFKNTRMYHTGSNLGGGCHNVYYQPKEKGLTL